MARVLLLAQFAGSFLLPVLHVAYHVRFSAHDDSSAASDVRELSFGGECTNTHAPPVPCLLCTHSSVSVLGASDTVSTGILVAVLSPSPSILFASRDARVISVRGPPAIA